jgi:rhodanese-related sulfurtransferase
LGVESAGAEQSEAFRLGAVLDAARELSGVKQPRRALEIALLSLMGSLGAMRGACLFRDGETGRLQVVSRGFASKEAQRLEQEPPAWLERLAEEAGGSPEGAALDAWTPGQGPERRAPAWVSLAAPWRAGAKAAGVLVLGERLQAGPPSEAERLAAGEIAAFLGGTVRQALAASRIGDLNARLSEKNQKLRRALDEADQARQNLDRKVFHLATVNDLTRELAGLNDCRAIGHSLLLLAQGAFQAAGGAVLMLDRRRREVLGDVRGAGQDELPDPDRLERTLYGCLGRGGLEGLHPLSAALLEAPAEAAREAGVDLDASAGAFFMVDADFMGLLLLGPSLDGRPLDEDEAGLLRTHLTNALVFLENARSFEAVQRLNADLARRNEELSRTIEELREARRTISVMESMQLLMRSAVASEAERLGKASFWDYVLITAVSAAIALLFNAVSPNGIPLVPDFVSQKPPPRISAEQAAALDNPVVVDARPAADFERGHVPGAVNMPPGFVDMVYAMRLSRVDLDRPVLLYGRTVSRLYDREAALELSRRDHGRLLLLRGGLQAWREQGSPVEAGR